MHELHEVRTTKLVHGGQALGELANGKKIFVWNALPDETVQVRITKQRRDYAEGVAETISLASPNRVVPVDDAFLSTSPWQILAWGEENVQKKKILEETYAREQLTVPDISFTHNKNELKYRNKMEYSFWADDEGLHLALFHRASHGKRIIKGSSIARPEIDSAANKVLAVLNAASIRGSQLKTLVLRVNKNGQVIVGLFTKDNQFPALPVLEDVCQGVSVFYSNPKSPASIVTKQLYVYGQPTLTDEVLGTPISYDINAFFQVNLPMFEKALTEIRVAAQTNGPIVDMFAGTGAIGLVVGAQTLVESDPFSSHWARMNAKAYDDIDVMETSAEGALDIITNDQTIIFDPPRAGLHQKIIDRLLAAGPQQIIYLSCNPSTHARDIAKLQPSYGVDTIKGYNFFPRTPHIEALAVLRRDI